MTEKFHFETDDGRKIVLPPFNQIPFGVVRKLRKEDDAEQFFGLIEHVADPDTLEIIDTLAMNEIESLFSAWQKHAQVTVGESAASSSS